MRRIISMLLICSMSSGFVSQAQGTYPRMTVRLDNNWKFHFGNASDPQKDFYFGIANIYSKSGKAENSAIDPKFDDKEWQEIQLPHDWAVELPFVYSANFDVQSHGYKPVGGLYPQTSIGWYRKHFTVSQADSGRRFTIRFDGIFRDARIWLNGYFLGHNESGYLGVSYDITDYISFNNDNILVVRVDASQYEGWFYEGAGIYRHVWLCRTKELHFAGDGIFVWSKVNEKSAVVNIEADVQNDHLFPVKGSVAFIIKDRNGKRVASSELQPNFIDTRNKKRFKQQLTVSNPILWSTDNPCLYRVIAILRSGGIVTDSVEIRFGIRTIRFDPEKGFFLNGKNIKIKGVCCHQDHAGVGTALPDHLQYYRIRLLKEMGVNAYRTSHNAPTPELLDACDSLGMLVMDEQRLVNSSPEYMDQFERLIMRDRNHPSVFMWSIGNEEGYLQTTGIGKRIAQSLLAKQMELDPTRTSTYAADLPNIFTGINEVIPIRGFNYRQFAVADYHKSHPDQPIIGTEMGSTVTTRGIYEMDTIQCYLPDQDQTAPWWASKAEVWWKLCAAQPWFMGGFIWTGFDYRGEPTPFKWPNINSHFGVMDVCGFPKNIYYYYQSWWTDKDVLHISPHWNWNGHEGEIMDVWVNSNADNVELLLNGKSFGIRKMEQNSHLNWSIPFESGLLEAVAIRDGRKIMTSIETTGAPAGILLKADQSTMMADGQDAVVINVSVADVGGMEVPDATNLIRFDIKGDAKIIGVGNGDPSSHKPDKCVENQWQRRLFYGKCQLIIQSGNTPGNIEVEARSEGLVNGSVKIKAVK